MQIWWFCMSLRKEKGRGRKNAKDPIETLTVKIPFGFFLQRRILYRFSISVDAIHQDKCYSFVFWCPHQLPETLNEITSHGVMLFCLEVQKYSRGIQLNSSDLPLSLITSDHLCSVFWLFLICHSLSKTSVVHCLLSIWYEFISALFR